MALRKTASMFCEEFHLEKSPYPVGWRTGYRLGVRHTHSCPESSEKLRYSFQQHLMLVITPCCRSSIEIQALSTHQLYHFEFHDSHVKSFDPFPSSIRQQLPSPRRYEIVWYERNSLLLPVSRLSHPFKASSSRRKLLGIFLSKVQGFSRPITYTLRVDPIPFSGVTPRELPLFLAKQQILSETLTFESCSFSRAEPTLRIFEDTFLIHRS